MSKSYTEMLKHPNWQKKRLKILERDGFRCQTCSATEKTLHVHHKRYHWGKAPWEYDDALLVTVCEDCHDELSVIQKRLRAAFDQCLEMGDPGSQLMVIGFLNGLMALAKGQRAIQVESSCEIEALAMLYEATVYRAHAATARSASGSSVVDVGQLLDERNARFDWLVSVGHEPAAEGTEA